MYRVEDHGSICILRPTCPEAREWIEDHVLEPTWWAGGLVVEPRHLRELLAAMDADLADAPQAEGDA